MKEVKVEVSKLVASCLQRMIVEEIDNQKWWKSEDKAVGINDHSTRDKIIEEMQELANELEKQGIAKHIKCY